MDGLNREIILSMFTWTAMHIGIGK